MSKVFPKRLLISFLFIITLLTACSQSVQQTNSTKPPEPTSSQTNELNTIPAALLEAAAKLPPLPADSLPDWHGIALTPEYLGRSVEAKDIEDIAKWGFNYVRVNYGYKNFVFADETSLEPFTSSFEKLDKLIGWGIQYGVHINVTLYELPGSRDDIMKNSVHYRQAVSIWEMIAKRYANVPAPTLSYNLLNEPGTDVFTEEEYASFANELAETIWKFDDQKMIVSDGMTGQGWDGAAISVPVSQINPKVVQSIHFYPWHFLRRSAHLNLLQWPYEQGVTVNNMIAAGGEPLQINGSFPEGTEISVYLVGIDNINKGGLLTLRADGTKAGEQLLDEAKLAGPKNVFTDEGNPNVTKAEFGDNGNTDGARVEFVLNKSAKDLTFSVKGPEGTRVYLRELLLKIPTETEGYYEVVDNTKKPQGFDYKKGKFRSVYIPCTDLFSDRGSTVQVAADGSITSSPAFSEVDVFDLDTMKRYFASWRNWADEHNARVMCNEFGMPMALPKEARMAYLRSVLEVLDANQIPWAAHCERIEGWGPVVFENELKYGLLVLAPDGSYAHKDGYYIDQSALDLMKEFDSTK